jgi:hypothetical protein
VRIPKFEDPEVTQFMVEFMRDQERTNRGKLNAETANRSVLLYSPSKKVYEVTVNDSGVLVVTKVAG